MSLASTTKVTVRCPHTGRIDRRGPVSALNVASEPRRTRKTRVQSAATSPIVQSAAAVLAFALNASAVQPAFASSEELFTTRGVARGRSCSPSRSRTPRAREPLALATPPLPTA